MVSEYDLDATWATTVTQFIQKQISTFSASPDSLLGKIRSVPLTYGDATVQRTVEDPDTIASLARDWIAPDNQIVWHTQNLDKATLGKRIMVPRKTMAQNPEGVRIHVRDSGRIFKDTLEKLFITGASSKVIIRGVEDYPNATAGTINRPEMAYSCTTAGDWSTTSNIRTDIINSIAGLVVKRFYGPYLILAPSLVRPMLTEVIANTAVPISQWVNSTVGVNVAFSPYVHEAATKDDFNVFIIDSSMVSIGVSELRVDAYYDNKDHAYYYDWELETVPLFDILYDGSEYLKGVARLDARDWSD